MTSTPVALAQTVGPPADTAETAIAKSRELTDPIRRCKPGSDGAIVVCGSDTQANRLSPELRAIAGVGQSTKDSIPRAPPASAATLSKLPFNWVSMGGHYGASPDYNPLYELSKKMTDPAREADTNPVY